MLKITDVGFSYDCFQFIDGILYGEGTIYSEENGEEFYDNIRFWYDLSLPYKYMVCITEYDEDTFGDYLETIESLLVENIEDNWDAIKAHLDLPEYL